MSEEPSATNDAPYRASPIETHLERLTSGTAPVGTATGSVVAVVVLQADAVEGAETAKALRAGGYTVAIGSDLASAEQLLRQFTPALVILDLVRMESMQSVLASDGARRRVAVLVLVGSQASRRTRAVVDVHADGLMVKPLDSRGLLALSHAILLRTDPEQAPTTEDPLDKLFREVVTEHQPFVARAATSYCWDLTALVPDVVNDVLFSLWQSFPNFVSYDRAEATFRLDISDVDLHRWLGAAVRNRCAAARRAEARHAERIDAYEKHLAPGLQGGGVNPISCCE